LERRRRNVRPNKRKPKIQAQPEKQKNETREIERVKMDEKVERNQKESWKEVKQKF
jgi:hypothetical protein